MDDMTWTQVKYSFYNRQDDYQEHGDLLVQGSPEDPETIKRLVKQLQYCLKKWYWRDKGLSGSLAIVEVNELIRTDVQAQDLIQAITQAHNNHVSEWRTKADKKRADEVEARERSELARLKDKYS